MIQMIQYPHTDNTKDNQKMIEMFEYVQKMIQYSHTEIAKDDSAKINDEDVQ